MAYKSPYRLPLRKKRYSDVKIYIPKTNGRADLSKKWYVYFYWRSKPDGKFDRQYKKSHDINRINTVRERRMAAEAVRDAMRQALERGWNPYGNDKVKVKEELMDAALEKALKVKTANKQESTIKGYEFHVNRFRTWLKQNGYLGMPARKFSLDHFYEYLDHIRFEYTTKKGDALTGTSINNHRRNLSAIFSQMKNERLIDHNFIKDIPAFDQEPINNAAFSLDDLKMIKTYLKKNDPYLIYFISFIIYLLLRPREICRLQVKDLDLSNMLLSVKTKTQQRSTRRIIEKIRPVIDQLGLEKANANDHIFTYKEMPANMSDVKLKTRVDHFGQRFRKVKQALNYGREYGIYSFRHTAIVDMYDKMVEQGKKEQEIYFELMPITQHKSIAGLKNYLRKHKQSIAADHSDLYQLDF